MKKPTRKEIDSSLKYSVVEGSANAVKTGIKTNFIVPFALLLGASSEMIGLISSLPDMLGILFQTTSTKIIKIFGGKKKTCRLFKLASNLFWLPIILIPFMFTNGIWWLLLFLCLRMILLQIDNTTWCSWISDIVPRNIRGKFFGKRNMFVNTASFLGSLIAGWILGIVDNIYGFAIIFSIAFTFNMISNYYLGKIVDTPIKKKMKVHFSFKHFLYGMKHHSNYSNFVLFRTLMNFSIYIVSPFWIVYALQNLSIGYFWYAISIGVFTIVNVISQKYWGKMTDRFGDKKIMFVCAFILPFAALIMVFVTNLWQLMFERILSGFVYAGFFMSSFNYLLNSSPSDDRSTFIANYKLFAGMGAAVAPLIGGLFVGFLSDSIILGLGAIQTLYLIAFVLRLTVASAMLTRLHSIRIKKNMPFRNVFLKTAMVYPMESIKHEFNYIIHTIHKHEGRFKKRLSR